MMSRSTLLPFVLRKLFGAVPMIIGVTLISFILTVYFGPDQTWELLGKNPTLNEIKQVRSELGYDRPFAVRYLEYLKRLATLDLGYTHTTGEKVRDLLARAVPVSIMLLAPGFAIGTALALVLAMLAAWFHGSRLDHCITGFSVVGMSLSFVIVIIGFQAIFGVWLGWFPVRGWAVDDLASYLHHITVPTLASVFVSLGYNTRFFRTVMVNELSAEHVRTACAFGKGPVHIMIHHVLRNSLLPIITRIMFSLPLIVISGSLLIESHFSIPGVGRITYHAILSGDQPVLMAVVGLSAVAFVLALTMADLLCRLADPRVRLKS